MRWVSVVLGAALALSLDVISAAAAKPRPPVELIDEAIRNVASANLTPVETPALYQAAGRGMLAAVGQEAPADLPRDSRGLQALYERLSEVPSSPGATALLDGALRGMVASLGDARTDYVSAAELAALQARTPGVQVLERAGTLRIVNVDPQSTDWKAGLRNNSILIAIDGQPTAGLSEAAAKARIAASASKRLTTTDGDGRTRTIASTSDPGCKCGYAVKRLGDTAVLVVSSVNDGTAAGIRAELNKAAKSSGQPTGYVLDLRENVGGILDYVVVTTDLFVESGLIARQRGRNARDIEVYSARRGDISGGAPLVVLVGPMTTSGGEIMAGALRDSGRAILVGQRTEGDGVVRSLIPVGDGSVMRVVTGRTETPAARVFDHTGIEPDIRVSRTEGKAVYGDPALGALDKARAMAEDPSLSAPIAATENLSDQLRSIGAEADDFQMAYALRLLRQMKPAAAR